MNLDALCSELEELGLRSSIAMSISFRRSWATLAIDARARGDRIMAAQAERQLVHSEVAQTQYERQLARFLRDKSAER